MQLILRLYYPSDIDLIAVRLKLGRRFTGVIRDILKAHIEGNYYSYEITEDIIRYKKYTDTIAVNLNLREDRDMDIIDFLKKIRSSYRSDIVKTLIRASYTSFPGFLFSFDDTDGTELKLQKKTSVSQNKKKRNEEDASPKKEWNIADELKKENEISADSNSVLKEESADSKNNSTPESVTEKTDVSKQAEEKEKRKESESDEPDVSVKSSAIPESTDSDRKENADEADDSETDDSDIFDMFASLI